MSDAVIVSVYPFNIVEKKPGLNPGVFKIPGAKGDDITVFDVPECKFYVYLDEFRPQLTQVVSAIVVAQSIVNDYIWSIGDTNFNNEDGLTPIAHPGLGFLPEKISKAEVIAKHMEFVKNLREVQLNWFKNLIKAADDDWTRFKRHSMITDIQRYASRTLKMDREWAIEPKPESVMECKACTNVISSRAIVCPHCKLIISPVEWKKLQFATT